MLDKVLDNDKGEQLEKPDSLSGQGSMHGKVLLPSRQQQIADRHH